MSSATENVVVVTWEVEIQNRYTGWWTSFNEFNSEEEAIEFMNEFLRDVEKGASLRVVETTRQVKVTASN